MQVALNSLWLKDATSRIMRPFCPDRTNQRFDFTSDIGYFVTRLIVEGTPVSVMSQRPSASDAGSSRSVGPVVPVLAGKKASGSVVASVKVVRAMIKRSATGRPEFAPSGQTFVDINQSTANVNYISHAVKEKWGTEYVLVTSDAIKIEDCGGTNGKLLLNYVNGIVFLQDMVIACSYTSYRGSEMHVFCTLHHLF